VSGRDERAGATRGGQLRRRASGDRALKGPTPHAPSSCQLSFPLSLFLSLSLFSLSLFLFLFLSALAARMCLSSFSLPLFAHHFFLFLSPYVLSLSLILTNYTVLQVFSDFPRLIFLHFPVVSSSHDPPPLSPSSSRSSSIASSYRHARPSHSEPRRRVSRFKLTWQRAP